MGEKGKDRQKRGRQVGPREPSKREEEEDPGKAGSKEEGPK